jgi:hypothetical protein
LGFWLGVWVWPDASEGTTVDINNAEMADAGGGPIVRGQLLIGSESDHASLGIPDHDRLLLEFRWDGLAIWPMTRVERGNNGFCRGKVEGLGILLRGLTIKHINELHIVPDETRALARGGYFCGSVISGTNSSLWPLIRYEMQMRRIPEGVAMTFFAQSVLHNETRDQTANSEALSGRDIRVDATISWESLTLAGFTAAAAHWKHEGSPALPSRHDDLDRSRDPRKLQDLLIYQGLTWPIVDGSLSLDPMPYRSRPTRFVSPQFDSYEMHFRDAPGVEILDNGFSRTQGLDCWVTIRQFGLEWLQAGLRWRDELSLSLAGDGLGEVRHWGCTARRGHTLGVHGQPIRALTLQAELGERGLQLDVEGELCDFEAQWIESQERASSGKLYPASTFMLHATLPWALLRLRRFPFARRADKFAVPQPD